jgi:hypothetical protein
MARTRTAFAALVVTALSAPAARSQQPPADLALVPADAAGFVHVRFGDAARSDQLKEFRDLIRKAGPQALETYSKRFTPDPATFDRLTAYFLPPAAGEREPTPVIIVRFSKPFDPAAVVKALLPGGQEAKAGSATFIRDEAKDVALRVIDNQTLLVCPPKNLAAAAAAPARSGPLAPALARAADGRCVVVAGLNAAALPPRAFADVPPPLRPLATARLATFAVELAAAPKVELRLRYADDADATKAEEAVRNLVQMGLGGLAAGRAELNARLTGSGKPGTIDELPEATGALVGLGAIAQVEEFLKALPLKKNGPELSLAVDVPAGLQGQLAVGGAVLPALLLPAVQKVREAAGRATSSNNLKQMALAMHNYNDAYQGKLPAHAIYSKDGKPLLSWRVAILPFIEQSDLYNQFHLDEPWDSEHNKALIAKMPKVYLPPNAPPTKAPGMTYYQIFVGGGAPWERSPKQPSIPRTFVDGTSNTIMIAEAGDPVIWTKPDDLPYDPAKPLPKLGNAWNPAGFLVALADGSVRSISPTISEKTMRAAITAAGGETLGPDW